MKRQEINSIILEYLKKYHVERVGIFGSFVRNQNHNFSDLDLLISFKKNPTLLQLVKIERELSELLHIKVDIVTEPSLTDPLLKKNIEKDLQIIS
ncbi:MAG: nucleotidyltransferase family protein [Ignavibacteria bacterium]